MGGAEKIWREGRLLQPGRCWKEGSDRQKQRKAKEQSAQQTENRTEQAVEEAEADGPCSSMQELAEQSGCDHGGGKDKKEGCELSKCGRGDESGETHGNLAIEPAGQEKTAEHAAESEQLRNEAAHGRAHHGVYENDAEDPVEWVHDEGAGGKLPCGLSQQSVLIIVAA